MATASYSLEFHGFWRDEIKDIIPTKPGIYCVYSCLYHRAQKTLTLKKLLYIGEAEDVNARLFSHEKLEQWEKYLQTGEMLCYSFALMPNPIDRERAEAALIYQHKPPANAVFVRSFPFDQTMVSLTGKTKFLELEFLVAKTQLLQFG